MRFVKPLCLVIAVFLLASCSTSAAEIKQSTHQEAMESYARAMEQGDYDTMAAVYPDIAIGPSECNSRTNYPEGTTDYEIAKQLWSKIRGTAEVEYLGILKSDGKACYTLEFTASQMPGENYTFNSDINVNFNFVLLENRDEQWFITDTATGFFYDENSFIDE